MIKPIAIAFLLALCAVAPASASPDHVRVTAYLEAPVTPGKTVWVAIRQDIAPGWHSYWRNPGEAGLATTLTWTLPAGVKAGEVAWPTPAFFGEGGVTNYGYTKEATLLVPLTADATAKSGVTKLTVDLLACEHVCVPQQTTLTLDLSKPSGSPALFAAARHALPLPYTGTSQFAMKGQALELTLEAPMLTGVTANKVTVFPATPGLVAYGSIPKLSIEGTRLVWRAKSSEGLKPAPAFAGVILIAGKGAYAFTARPSPALASTGRAAGAMGLLAAIALAFLGGLILNLMPCVLPIISMKALSLARTGSDTALARQEGLFYLGGVMATFAAMAGLLLALKAGGAALGWGFQLQSPLVVMTLALLMAGIGLNLLGVFELPIGFAGAGERLTRRGSWMGAFFTGALAVVVASPCTAPFMGAALGFALTQPVWSAAAVFLALGFGFGLPFAALSASPALIRLIPKPGLWMNRFRQALAFPMFATALWLLWVLGRQSGLNAVIIALAIGLAVVALVWLLGMLRGVWLWAVAAVGLACVVFSASFVTAAAPSQQLWAPWSAQAVGTARRAGHPVLVDFSAAWCVTCLVNERLALSDGAVLAHLQRDHVVTLKGDWTNPDPVITTALHDHGRDGVPLYLLYSPDGHTTELPQVLTPDIVMAALAKMETRGSRR